MNNIFIKSLKWLFLPTILMYLGFSFIKLSFKDSLTYFVENESFRITILIIEVLTYIILVSRYHSKKIMENL